MLVKLNKLLAIALCFGLVACGGEAPKPESIEQESTVDQVEEVEILEEEEDDFNLVLPSPLQIASIFKKSGLVYKANIANPITNKENYSSNLSKSLNFGVYSADLSYCVLNNQTQEAMEYMKVIRQLSDEIGLSTIFQSEDMFSSFENNLGNEDSIITVLATIQEKLDEHLEEMNQEYLSAVYFTGGWVESVYLGSKVITDKQEHNLVLRIVEQMTLLDVIVKGLEHHPHPNEVLGQLIGDLKTIHQMYNGIENVKKYNNDELDLDQLTIPDEDLNKILAQIEAIRTKIING